MKNKLFTAFFLLFSGLVFAQEESLSDLENGEVSSSSEISQEISAPSEEVPSSEESLNTQAYVAEVASSSSVAQVVVSSSSLTADDVWKDAGASSSSVAGGLLDALYPVSKDEAIAKGRIYGGVSLSLIQGNTDEDALNILIGDVYDAYGYTFTVEAFGGYFIRDAMALGLRTGYSRTWFDVDFALMEDLLDLAEHRKYVSNGFFVQPLLKNYLKVLDSRNFYFFNETSISFEYSYGLSQTDDGEDMSKSRNRSWSIDVGINPGICIMVLNRFAFETSVGLLGLSSSVIEVEENNETRSQFVYNIVNFTINLLALDFSLVYFF